jgi:hypothetical protein
LAITSSASAAPAGAAVRADRKLRPERLAGLERELGAVARLGVFDPIPQAFVGGRVLRGAKKTSELVDACEAFPAEVVLPPLENGDAHISTESRGGGRHIVRQELFLERFRRRRHHDSLSGDEGGDEIGKALPRACPGLGHQVLVAFERIRHCLGERTLAAPGLEARKRSREAAEGTEEVIHETREPS